MFHGYMHAYSCSGSCYSVCEYCFIIECACAPRSHTAHKPIAGCLYTAICTSAHMRAPCHYLSSHGPIGLGCYHCKCTHHPPCLAYVPRYLCLHCWPPRELMSPALPLPTHKDSSLDPEAPPPPMTINPHRCYRTSTSLAAEVHTVTNVVDSTCLNSAVQLLFSFWCGAVGCPPSFG